MAKSEAKPSLKTRMAIPPIPQQATRTRSDRNTNRVRLEISVEQCNEFIALLSDKLKSTNILEPKFKPLYAVYYALKAQVGRATSVSKGVK